MSEGKRLDYFHEGAWKTGFFDKDSGVFVATAGDKILTVFTTTEDYINRLMRMAP